MVRSPASVLMVTGNSTRKITTSTFDQMPMPSQRMNKGASAIVGVAYSPEIHGCNARLAVALLAIAKPRTIPITLAMT